MLNVVMFYKLDLRSNRYKYISSLIITITIMLIYYKYYNSISIGFLDGLPYGEVGGNLYYDSYGYYHQSIQLGDLWLNGGFKDWIFGNIPKYYVERGIYNYLVVFNSAIRVLFGKDLNTWMLIKYQFSIMSIALMYKISIKFVKEKYALISLILFNLYPGYLLVNTDLLRDNIISFFIILTSYILMKSNKKPEWTKIALLLSVVTYLRVYMGIILAVSLFIYLSIDRLKLKKIVSYLIVLIILILILGKVMENFGYGFLALKLLKSGEIYMMQWNNESVNTPIKLFIRSVYFVCTGGKPIFDNNYYILELYNNISPIFILIISLPTIFMFPLIRILSKEERKFYIFSFIYSVLAGSIITYGFSSIIPRLYICWLWTQCISFCMLISKLNKAVKN